MNSHYTIEEHKHRLAAWVAARAASASPKCRFSVEKGKVLLEAIGFNASFTLERLPLPKKLNAKHKEWRENIIAKAKNEGISKEDAFSHGVAAKLINCYLKVRFVCAGLHADPRVESLHPPIDALLLEELRKENFGGQEKEWREYGNKGWSNFTSDDYEKVIDLMKESLKDEPLWTVEKYWRGHQ